jgi:hypothetical protein
LIEQITKHTPSTHIVARCCLLASCLRFAAATTSVGTVHPRCGSERDVRQTHDPTLARQFPVGCASYGRSIPAPFDFAQSKSPGATLRRSPAVGLKVSQGLPARAELPNPDFADAQFELRLLL